MDLQPTDSLRSAPDAASALAMLSSPAMDLAFLRPSRVGVPSAWYTHVPFAHWLVGAAEPRAIVELGTHNGVSYAAFCEAVARTHLDARCTAIDTWKGDEHAGSYGDDVLDDLRRFHDPRYGGFSELMRCTFDSARPFVPDGSVDLLHIDGLHTYDAVRHDWETWRPTLTDRGVVLFHDVNEHQGSFGVWRLWEELRRAFPSFTFLHGHGLGVLAAGDAVPDPVRRLCELGRDPAAASRIRERFAQLGERWDSLCDQLSAVDRRRAAEAANAGLRGEVARLEAAAASLADYRQRATQAEHEIAMLDDASATLEQARARETRLAAKLARTEGELEHLRGELAFRAAEWERVHQVMASRDADRADLQRHLDEVRGSAWWRIGGPLRRLDRAVPGLARARRRTIHAARLAISGELGLHRQARRRRDADVASLRDGKLFDAAFYRATQPDLARSGHDPWEHYALVGAREGARPNAAFDTGWYLAQNPGLAESGENPLLHWQRIGATSGLDPSPLFDTRWYVSHNPDAATNPLLHYLQVGGPGHRDPNPMLDAEAYLLEHDHARQSGLTALEHWVRFGVPSGLNPNPLFNAAWYRDRHGLPPGADPLAHWMRSGREQDLPISALVERSGLPPAIAFAAEPDPEVSIVVPVWGHYADTVRCLYALMASSGDAVRFEVLVADDHPQHRTAPLLDRRVAGLHIHENPTNLGFLRSCNEAARRARGRVLLFLNNDTQVQADWLDPIVALLAARPDAGMVGCKLLNADGTLQEAGGSIGRDGWGIPYGSGGEASDPDHNFVREVDVVVGACIAVRREAWEEAGGFDEDFAPAFYEEFDLAFTLRKLGWRVFYQPASAVEHFGSNSYGAQARDRQSTRNHARFCRKWAPVLRDQPAPGTPELRLRARPQDARTILFIDDRVPEWDRNAGALTDKQYIGLWQSLGFHVVFAPVAVPMPAQPYTGQLQQMGVEVLHPPATLETWLARHGGAVDVIWTARPDVTGPILSMLREQTSATILYYPHDLHHVRERRRWELEGNAHALKESERYRRLERRIVSQVDRVLAISAEEASIIRDLAPGADVHMIPPYLYPAPPSPPSSSMFAERDAVLFVGGYVHPPNLDAARYLATEIMPLVWQAEPGIRLILAGASPTAEILSLAGPRIEVPGFLPDLTPLHRRTRISVSPLRYGAGVKGKVVAALWEGLPVVCTRIANEGLDLLDGTGAAIADTTEELAGRLVALWRDPTACAAMAAAGQDVVRRKFTVEAASSVMSKLVAAGRRRDLG